VGYQWDFGTVWRHMDWLWAGAGGTLRLTAAALALATPLGLTLALLRLARIPGLSWLAVAYIDFFRTAAALVLVFWFFYAFPVLLRLDLDAFAAAALALGLQAAAYLAEVFRGGIVSIDRGQWEAARSLGMPYRTALRHVILPQAVRRMIPVFFTRAIELLKTTSLAAAIAYSELTYSASRLAAETYRPIETFAVVGLMYFVAIFGASQVVRQLERRLAVADR
jgi:polar amino acid transport system permease protein